MGITSCSRIEEPEFKTIKKVSIEKFGLGKSCIKADLLFFNPNTLGVTLKEMKLDLFVDGSLMGHTDQDLDLKIGRRSDFIIPLKIEVDTKTTMKNLVSGLIKGEANISVKGSIKVSKAGISKLVPVNFSSTQKIDLF
jgi:LEA14-like dessication related protein